MLRALCKDTVAYLAANAANSPGDACPRSLPRESCMARCLLTPALSQAAHDSLTSMVCQ